MATDLSTTQSAPPAARQSGRLGIGQRSRKLILVAIGLAAVGAAAVGLLPSAGTDSAGTNLRHTIQRGDLLVTVIEQGTLESSENTEIKCKVRGQNTVIWVVEGGTEVQAGDELVRLDTLFIEEQINERSKYAHWSRSAAERSKADVARSELAIGEYVEGRYRAELMTLEKDLAIAESNLRTAKNMLSHAQLMAERGYLSALQVEQRTFAVKQAQLEVEVKQTDIDVLNRFTKEEELETLRGNLAADKARHEADKERAFADAHRRDRALEELEHCVVTAPRAGMVIYPSVAEWKDTPDIEEGATVHKDQILLLMPDLAKMQVKIGVHESIVDRVKPSLRAKVTLPEKTIEGTVDSVATVTRPAGWWTGNVVKYDTIIKLPPGKDLKPGMSAEVEVIIAEYFDVLSIPVAAVMETNQEYFCWVETAAGPERRKLQLGDTNDVFIVVESGLQEGEKVVLNPLAMLDDAQLDVQGPQPDNAQPQAPQPEDPVQRQPAATGD